MIEVAVVSEVPTVFPTLDPVLHAPARLQLAALLETLDAGETATFLELQHLTGLTAGNLSTHLRRLEEHGYLAVDKAFEDRTPVTRVAITPTGREALAAYRDAMGRHLDPAEVERLQQEMRT